MAGFAFDKQFPKELEKKETSISLLCFPGEVPDQNEKCQE